MAEGPDAALTDDDALAIWQGMDIDLDMLSEVLRSLDRQRRRSHRRKLRRQRALNPQPKVDRRVGKLISHLQENVYLAVRNGYQKPIEIAADEMLKRWKHLKLLDFSHVDDQVSEGVWGGGGGGGGGVYSLSILLRSVLPVFQPFKGSLFYLL